MENKKWLLCGIIILLLSLAAGFFMGRWLTMKRTAREFAEFARIQAIRPEMEEYRKNITPLLEEKFKLIELLSMAIERGDSTFAYRVADELGKVQNQMLFITVRHLLKTGGYLPPEIRREFLDHILMGRLKTKQRRFR